MSRKRDEDSKRRLEHKWYLAEERPDEIFDLSDCGLREVPSGTFSLVKVLLKTKLFLQNNSLKDLKSGGNLSDLQNITFLDLNSNLLRQIPDGFNRLSSLQVLDLSKNYIQSLPSCLMQLHNLQTLNLEDNRISIIPNEIGNLTKLTVLQLAGNPISELPRQLSYTKSLRQITLPADRMRSPPPDVCKQGAAEILRFLRGGPTTNELSPPPTETPRQSPATPGKVVPVQEFQQRRLRAADLEKQIEEERNAQLQLALQATHSRKQVLGRLAEEDALLQSELLAVQMKRDTDRSKLVTSLLSAEDSAELLIKELLSKNEAARRRESIADLDNFKLLVSQPDASFELRRKEILDSMQAMLSATDEAYRVHYSERQAAQQRALAGDQSDNRGLQGILATREEKQKQLTKEIALEEDAQKAAFARLQMQQDSQAQRLRRDIALVEQELCQLTMAELDRKAKRTEINQSCLNQRRMDLVNLLTQLNKEQQVRHNELNARLKEMEQRRHADQLDYWLVQFQRLLDNKPADLSAKLDPEVDDILRIAGGLDFESNFQYHHITYNTLKNMTDEDLQRIGVYALGVRRAILDAVIGRIQSWKLSESKLAAEQSTSSALIPSAPPVPEKQNVIPTAPPLVLARSENECCICQNAQCIIIFLQCGHVCTCANCAEKVTNCPLCRSNIVQRIQLQS